MMTTTTTVLAARAGEREPKGRDATDATLMMMMTEERQYKKSKDKSELSSLARLIVVSPQWACSPVSPISFATTRAGSDADNTRRPLPPVDSLLTSLSGLPGPGV